MLFNLAVNILVIGIISEIIRYTYKSVKNDKDVVEWLTVVIAATISLPIAMIASKLIYGELMYFIYFIAVFFGSTVTIIMLMFLVLLVGSLLFDGVKVNSIAISLIFVAGTVAFVLAKYNVVLTVR